MTVIVAGLGFLVADPPRAPCERLKRLHLERPARVKTPLSIIRVRRDARRRSHEVAGAATEYAGIIWRGACGSRRLIDNVLDFAKIERGWAVYEFAEADVGGRARDRILQRRLAAAGMTSKPTRARPADGSTDERVQLAAGSDRQRDQTLRRGGQEDRASLRHADRLMPRCDSAPGFHRRALADLRALLPRARDPACRSAAPESASRSSSTSRARTAATSTSTASPARARRSTPLIPPVGRRGGSMLQPSRDRAGGRRKK